MKFERENKGFSLVELIVVIAIFSVVGVVVGGFLFAASRSYSINANELNLQDEAQLVANQVQEMILDTAYGISYKYVVTDETGSQLIDFMNNDANTTLPEGDLSQKDLYIYGKETYTHLSWDAENKQLYLMEYKSGTSDPVDDMVGLAPKGVLLGDYIEDFKVDLTKVADKRMVSFNILFKKQGTDRDYLVARNVSLRNDVMTNKEATEVYAAVGIEFTPKADKIEVEPHAPVYLWPGEAQQYIVKLLCTARGGVPTQNVTWVVASGDGVPLHEDTKMNVSNLLSISPDEQSSKLFVSAYADGYNYSAAEGEDPNITLSEENLEVNIRQIRGLTITGNNFEDEGFPITKGGTYIVKVRMDGDNLPSNVTEAGGITAYLTAGSTYATISAPVINGLTAEFTITISDTAPEDGEIGLAFRPTKAEFSDIHTETKIYKFDGVSTDILQLYSDSGLEWLRDGVAKTRLVFDDEAFADTICNPDGTLKPGYSVRFKYRVYDDDYVLCRTLSSTEGASESKITDSSYITDIVRYSVYSAEAYLSSMLFLQSGTVVVSAELVHNTSGTEAIVATSDNLTYFIPEASISFKRALVDEGSSNMKSYITKNMNTAPIYIDFTGGFAGTDYQIVLNKAVCDSAEYGSISESLSSAVKRLVVVAGNKDAEYKFVSDNTIELTYGGLSNKVTIVLTSANVIGTEYYVPLTMDEWTQIGYIENGANKTVQYVYYIDDNHYMYIEYLNGSFSKATFNYKQDMAWENAAYTMNRVNKTWDLATP